MIKLDFKNKDTLFRTDQVIAFSVPFAQKTLSSPDKLCAQFNSVDLTCEKKVLSRWPDNSIRWLHITAELPANHEPDKNVTLLIEAEVQKQVSQFKSVENESNIQIENSQFRYSINKHNAEITVTKLDSVDVKPWTINLQLTNENATLVTFSLLSIQEITTENSLFPCIQIRGQWPGYPELYFTAEVTFYSQGRIFLRYQFHNANRAKHPGGIWDLGDPNSCLIGSLQLVVAGEAISWGLKNNPNQTFHLSSSTAISLTQDSSGGENWHSINHVTAENSIATSFKGYKLYQGNSTIETGERAQPVAFATNGLAVYMATAKFWQKFPQSIEVSNCAMVLSFLPANTSVPHELQAGERTTREVWLQFQQQDLNEPDTVILDWIDSPAIPLINSEYYSQTLVMPWYSAGNSNDQLAPCLLEPKIFFDKREIIDEFGWRNFGDIFADHETLYQPKNETPFISHYNNQYDPIYGFTRQFILTGNIKWFELLDDLARHVVDIDIYNTEYDRCEYNNGLFWHTDHYVTAHTATHRTYSAANKALAHGQALGGGPGPEHCYTTGLCYHYWLTGYESSKLAVLKLADWITNYHQGDKSLLSQLLSIKEYELPRIRKIFAKERISAHRYPFTRGTGNYITALLDAFEISSNKNYLTSVEAIIHDTLHPSDDIEARDLLNAEIAWSYLILLTSIIRYINTKLHLQEFDKPFFYARDSFLHYAHWIKDHEKPFLDQAERLDYPNDTWLAQDIRKAMLLYQAGWLCSDPKIAADFAQSANSWLVETTQALQKSDTLHFARIQIILLQNYGPQLGKPILYQHLPDSPELTYSQVPAPNLLTEFKAIIKKIWRGIRHFHPKKELRWLKARL